MKRTDAAVFILLGQSNAVGYTLPMREEDKILQPMKNVFGLSRTLNQSFDTKELHWTGYTSHDMNLGESNDDTYSIANLLAQIWQDQVDAGADLPDLHIVHIALGAQGFTEKYMWYPDREKKLVPGPLFTADISLYPFTLHILSMLKDSFEKLGKTYEIMGMHWLGSADDMSVPLETLSKVLDGLYLRMFREMRESTGIKFPITLYKLEYPDRAMELDPSGNYLKQMYFISATFEYLSRSCENVYVFDNRWIPHYDPHIRGNDLYNEIDVIHHTEQTNRWITQKIFDDFKNSLSY